MYALLYHPLYPITGIIWTDWRIVRHDEGGYTKLLQIYTPIYLYIYYFSLEGGIFLDRVISIASASISGETLKVLFWVSCVGSSCSPWCAFNNRVTILESYLRVSPLMVRASFCKSRIVSNSRRISELSGDVISKATRFFSLIPA